MRIAVIGILGYVGSRLAVKLQRLGHEIIGIDNGFSNKTSSIYGIEIINTNLNSSQTINELRRCDVVINLAAISGVEACDKNPDRALDTNILGVYNLCKICGDKRIPLIFTSSASTNFPEYNTYAQMKLAGNEIIESFSRAKDFPALVFSIGNIYGEHKIATVPIFKDTVINKFKRQSESGKITVYGNGKQTRDFVHIEDVVDSIIAGIKYLQTNQGFHKMNLSSSKLTKISEIAEHFSKKNGCEIEYVENPRNEVVEMCKLPNKELIKKLGVKPKKLELK